MSQHWSCCLSQSQSLQCSQSPPHLVTTTVCSKCLRDFHPDYTRAGECAHRGVFHRQFEDCTPECGLRLRSDIGRAHWTCCFGTEFEGPCKKSPEHSQASLICARCSHEYDPRTNTAGDCQHEGAWHSAFGHCGPLCALKLFPLKIGTAHWSCCFETISSGPCKKSKAHVPSPVKR
eukprot:TRINITY_DN3256_c0_g1_i1.p1 TRINITY_DN3256_c0_g1~~TRINITY_DN3256_c0_g1_i1.p1  ORF type:complete len:196 (+),score=15.37 TRINITY_DN3256_c0_g1_i1:63-590(+)